MKKNINTLDRFVRALLVIVFMMLVLNNDDDKVIMYLAGFLGFYCLLTTILEVCLFYNFLNVSTRPSRRDKGFY